MTSGITQLSAEEAARVAALRSYDVLDVPEPEELRAVARLAARICGVPTAAVNLIDADRQVAAASEGAPRETVPREHSLCGTAVTLTSSVYVPDALNDPFWAQRAAVNGDAGHVRFYAASQLRTPEGHVVGTVCAYDETPRQLDDDQRQALDDLAQQVMQWLEARRRARRLEDAVDELERSNSDLTAFAGRVAHDLRNPLTAVTGFLQIAERRFSDEMSERAQSVVGSALAAANRMRDLVDALLSYATAGTRPAMVEVSLAEVAAAVVADVSAAVDAAGASVVPGELPTVTTDPTLIRQLLQNLVANAVKFARPDVTPVVRVEGSRVADGWSLSVIDNGRGIPVEERERVFAVFGRASNAGDTPGTGIGLATCARIAEVLGGEIAVSESAGGGATFTLRVRG